MRVFACCVILLFPFAVILYGLPTKLYELLGIITIPEEVEATHGDPVPAPVSE